MLRWMNEYKEQIILVNKSDRHYYHQFLLYTIEFKLDGDGGGDCCKTDCSTNHGGFNGGRVAVVMWWDILVSDFTNTNF